MYYVIVLSGDIQCDEEIRNILDKADRIICADGGARHLRKLDVLPDILLGDLDSITRDDLNWLQESKIPVVKYPSDKDATDSELALDYAFKELSQPDPLHELILIGVLGSRPDHVLANQLLSARCAQAGWRITMTDGISYIYTLTGGQQLALNLPRRDRTKVAVSLIPVSKSVKGISCSGLKYNLDRADIKRGSTLGVSNQVADSVPEQDKSGTVPVQISLNEGVLLVVITPEN